MMINNRKEAKEWKKKEKTKQGAIIRAFSNNKEFPKRGKIDEIQNFGVKNFPREK